jgi:hypothetical protein
MQVLIGETLDGVTGVRDSDATPEPVGPLTPDEAIEALLPHASDRFLIRLKTELIPDERWGRAERAAESDATPLEELHAPDLGGEG